MKSAFALTGSMVTPLAWSRTDEIEGLTPKLEWPVVESHEMAGGEAATHWSYLTTYNNYYEFGEDKDDAVKRSQDLRTRPWTLEISGECESPGILDFDTLMRAMQVEERIYRLRCIERWSMVVPWNGFELASLLKLARPTSRAKFVEFTSLADPEQMPGVRPRAAIEWPYTEGLRIDEAMHPLTLMAVGVYGRELPNQNGAPIRLVVPWKYGFKSIKAIVRIRFVEQQPATSWNTANPREHGFYSNVNPNVRHPRWSQKAEKRIGDWFKRPTLMFNGYADQVGSLYAGMDLQKYR